MRIAIDAHMIGDHSGGNESYYTNILKNMTVDDKDTVYIFVKSGTPVEKYFEKFTVIEFEQKNAFTRKSDYIFTVSENAKNDIAASYNIKKEKIVVTYDAVNDEFRKLSASELKSEELRSKYNITGDYILSVGNLQPRKNLVRLIIMTY